MAVSHSPLPNISADHLPSLPSSTTTKTTSALGVSSSFGQQALATSSLQDSASPRLPSTATNSPGRSKHQSSLSSAFSRPNRVGLLNLAALARDKTTNAIASLAEPSIRTRVSSGSLYRTAQSSPTSPTHNSNYNLSSSSNFPAPEAQVSAPDSDLSRSSSTPSVPTTSSIRTVPSSISTNRQSLLETNPPSQAYSDTASDTPAPIAFVPSGKNHNKMHQTSSRLLRMTSDDRPFTRVRDCPVYNCTNFY